MWREAASLVSTRWQVFLEAEPESRAWAFASYVAALDAEEAAAAEMAALCPRPSPPERGRRGTPPSSLFRRDRRGAKLHPRRRAPVGCPARALDADPAARGRARRPAVRAPHARGRPDARPENCSSSVRGSPWLRRKPRGATGRDLEAGVIGSFRLGVVSGAALAPRLGSPPAV